VLGGKQEGFPGYCGYQGGTMVTHLRFIHNVFPMDGASAG